MGCRTAISDYELARGHGRVECEGVDIEAPAPVRKKVVEAESKAAPKSGARAHTK